MMFHVFLLFSMGTVSHPFFYGWCELKEALWFARRILSAGAKQIGVTWQKCSCFGSPLVYLTPNVFSMEKIPDRKRCVYGEGGTII